MIQAAAEGAGAGAAQTIAQLSKELEELTYALEEKEATHDEHIGEMVQAGEAHRHDLQRTERAGDLQRSRPQSAAGTRFPPLALREPPGR